MHIDLSPLERVSKVGVLGRARPWCSRPDVLYNLNYFSPPSAKLSSTDVLVLPLVHESGPWRLHALSGPGPCRGGRVLRRPDHRQVAFDMKWFMIKIKVIVFWTLNKCFFKKCSEHIFLKHMFFTEHCFSEIMFEQFLEWTFCSERKCLNIFRADTCAPPSCSEQVLRKQMFFQKKFWTFISEHNV